MICPRENIVVMMAVGSKLLVEFYETSEILETFAMLHDMLIALA